MKRDEWDLDSTTENLDYDYANWKDFEKEKNADKDRFFQLADEALEAEASAERVYEAAAVGDESESKVLARITRFNPGWIVDDFRVNDVTGVVEAILVEDITLKPFTHVHKELGRVFTRSIRSGQTMIDDEYMYQADPDLYQELTFELPWGERVMPPLSSLDAQTLARCAPFIYTEKPRVALAAPRDAKPEELE